MKDIIAHISLYYVICQRGDVPASQLSILRHMHHSGFESRLKLGINLLLSDSWWFLQLQTIAFTLQNLSNLKNSFLTFALIPFFVYNLIYSWCLPQYFNTFIFFCSLHSFNIWLHVLLRERRLFQLRGCK